MKHEKFVQDAKITPSRYYRNPSDVVRDRRLTNEDRLEILDAWERETRDRAAPEPVETAESRLDELRRLRRQVEGDTADRRSSLAAGE